MRLVTVDDVFGGWGKVQSEHFASGGLLDQIYGDRYDLKVGLRFKAGAAKVRRPFVCSKVKSLRRRVLPGLPLSLGITLFYVAADRRAAARRAGVQGREPRAGGLLAHHLLAARRGQLPRHRAVARWRPPSFNLVFGMALAWVLVRYRFPGRRLVDALVDLPFALPTAVAGIALTTLFAAERLVRRGPRGARHQGRLHAARHHGGDVLHQPALRRAHGAAGAGGPRPGAGGSRADARRLATAAIFRRVVLPLLVPALLAGVSLSFARSLGEFGAIIFIAGNQPFSTEITALLAFIRLEEYDYQAAARDRLGAAHRRLRDAGRHQPPAGAGAALHGQEPADERGAPQKAARRVGDSSGRRAAR